MNVAAADLEGFLTPHKNKGTIVLYSNGMTHSAQARDALARMGFTNAYNSDHIPGSARMDPEHFRGAVGGVSSMLLPADMIARHLGLLGIVPS